VKYEHRTTRGQGYNRRVTARPDVEQQRAALRAERDELYRRHRELQAEDARVQGTRDRAVLQAHAERLRRHAADVQNFTERLERFHEEFGPLGN
jgi:molecular chaperone GrpE (heat shock protein)